MPYARNTAYAHPTHVLSHPPPSFWYEGEACSTHILSHPSPSNTRFVPSLPFPKGRAYAEFRTYAVFRVYAVFGAYAEFRAYVFPSLWEGEGWDFEIRSTERASSHHNPPFSHSTTIRSYFYNILYHF